MNFTTLRLRNKLGETDGNWFAETITLHHIKTLREYRQAEPGRDWRLETRGYSGIWHIYEPNFQEFYEVK